MRRLAALLLIALASLRGEEVVDRIAVTVGTEIITLTEVLREIRLQAFQENGTIDTSPQARKAAAERLVDRTLITMEMTVNRFPTADRVDAVAQLEEMKKRFSSAAAFEAALRKFSITEEDLIDRIQSQITILRFIDFRFQTVDQPTQADVEKYYRDTFVPMAKKSGVKTIPPLEEAQPKIEEILNKERVNAAMEAWLEQTRSRTAIQYHDGAFQ